VADIEQFTSDLSAIAEMLRQCRLNEDKQVKARKEAIKSEELNRASNEWNAVIVGYNEKLWQAGKMQMPAVHVDFQGAIKGLKTVASLRSKLNDEIARGKIEASATFEKITSNLDLLKMHAGEYIFLFSDIQTLCVEDADYIQAIATQRVNDHKAQEDARIQAEAKRIADEQIERDRFNAEQKAKHEAAEQARTQAEAQRTQEAPAQAPTVQAEIAARTISQRPAVTTEQCPSHELSDYHRGHIDGKKEGITAGLELAIAIFKKHGDKAFVKAVEDFIEVGAQEAMKAA
jgi:hypothetical protein